SKLQSVDAVLDLAQGTRSVDQLLLERLSFIDELDGFCATHQDFLFDLVGVFHVPAFSVNAKSSPQRITVRVLRELRNGREYSFFSIVKPSRMRLSAASLHKTFSLIRIECSPAFAAAWISPRAHTSCCATTFSRSFAAFIFLASSPLRVVAASRAAICSSRSAARFSAISSLAATSTHFSCNSAYFLFCARSK